MLLHIREIIFVMVFLLNFILCKNDEIQKICKSKETCKECIQVKECAWCMQPEFNGKEHCFQPLSSTSTSSLTTAKNTVEICPEEFIYNPQSMQRISLNRAFLSDPGSLLQVSPQRISIHLRIDEEYHIQMRYYVVPEGSSFVQIKDNSSDPLEVTYFSKCSNDDDVLRSTNECDGLKVGDIVDFEIAIRAKKCPENLDDLKPIHFYPVGVSESLIVDVELLCDCPCEQKGHPLYEEVSSKCSMLGTYKCGMCHCNEGYFGKHCECYQNFNEEDCRPTINDPYCSGRGICICGLCECSKRPNYNESIFGKYCECDNFSCDRHDGLYCGRHGTCVCGKCICRAGWTGNACECSTNTDTCYFPGDNKICSGHGECFCGQCKCLGSEDGVGYSGKYCEHHPSHLSCTKLKDCVECQMYNIGPFATSELCSKNCKEFTPIAKEELDCDAEGDILCAFTDNDDCRYSFCYNNVEDKINVMAVLKRKCPAGKRQ